MSRSSCLDPALARRSAAETCIVGLYGLQPSAHGDRAMMPVVAVGGAGFLRSINWYQLPAHVRAIKEMHAYLSGPAMTDPPTERHARVRTFFADAFHVIGSHAESPEIIAIVVDDMTGKVLSELADESQPAQRPGAYIPMTLEQATGSCGESASTRPQDIGIANPATATPPR